MLAAIELISFHIGLFVVSLCCFLVISVMHSESTFIVASVTLVGGLTCVTLLSIMCNAHLLETWRKAKLYKSSLMVLIGHLAPILGIYLVNGMAKATAASEGLALLPIIAWGMFFYSIGLFSIMFQLMRAKLRDAPNP